jgi:hypothetical protein
MFVNEDSKVPHRNVLSSLLSISAQGSLAGGYPWQQQVNVFGQLYFQFDGLEGFSN